MSPLPLIRSRWATALAASVCLGCLGPELTVPPVDAGGAGGGAGGAGGGAGAPTDGCLAWAQAPDAGALTVDFEKMMTPHDAFQLGELRGNITNSGSASGSSSLFLRQGHGEPSKQSLLLMLGEQDWGFVALRWGVCLDATTRSGISFWAKGEPTTGSVYPNLPGVPPDTECTSPLVNVAVTTEWQMFTFTWRDFCPNSVADLAFPSKLTGLQFNIQGTSIEPWLALDDVSLTD